MVKVALTQRKTKPINYLLCKKKNLLTVIEIEGATGTVLVTNNSSGKE